LGPDGQNRVVGGGDGGGGGGGIALDTSVDIGGEFSFRSRHLSLLALAATGRSPVHKHNALYLSPTNVFAARVNERERAA